MKDNQNLTNLYQEPLVLGFVALPSHKKKEPKVIILFSIIKIYCS